jgi:hypothetical protein
MRPIERNPTDKVFLAYRGPEDYIRQGRCGSGSFCDRDSPSAGSHRKFSKDTGCELYPSF